MAGIAWEIVTAGFLAAFVVGIVDCRMNGRARSDWAEHDYVDEDPS